MSAFSTHSSRRSIILRTFGTLLAILLMIYVLSQQGWNEIGSAIRQVPLWRLALALGLMILSRLAVVARWHILLRSAGVKISFWQTLRVTFAGLFSSNFLPTTIGGDVVRLAGAIQLKYDAAICTASLIVDRLVGIAGMAMALPFGLPNLFQGYSPATQLPLINTRPPQLAIAAFWGRWWKRGWDKVLELVQRIFKALGLWLKHPQSLLASLVYSWVNMLCLFGILQLLLAGMGDSLPLWVIAGLYSLVYFVTLIPISINGYGLQEVSMTLVFSTFGGASVHNGATTALLFRALMMLVSLPGFLFVPGMLSSQKKPTQRISNNA